MTIIYFILMLGIIVLVHEFGHFLFAKLFGVYVYEFSIGMGPRIWSKKDKKKETTYSLKLLPIGGSVALAGEEVDDDKKIPKNRKLQAKPVWQRFLIMFFGAGFNFVLAIVVLFLSGLIFGSPNMDPVFTKVVKDSPMYEAGVRDGDKVLAIDGNNISTIDDVGLYIAIAGAGEEVEFKIKNTDGRVFTEKVKPRLEKDDKGKEVYRFGVTYGGDKDKGILEAGGYAIKKTGSLFKQMFVTFKCLFTGKLGMDNVGGPVAIYGIVGDSKEAGMQSLMMLLALLCINVGFINLIPFPAFDGGRILFLFIEKIKGSPVKAETENKIHMIGFMLLMILIIYITIKDVIGLF